MDTALYRPTADPDFLPSTPAATSDDADAARPDADLAAYLFA